MAKDTAKSTASTTKTTDSTPAPAESAPAASDGAPAGSETAPAAKKSGGGGSRPISYFSSVSTEEYRSGWDAIFGKGDASPTTKRKRKPKLPATLELSLDDLDVDARAALEAAIRKRAKRRRLDYDALAEAGGVQWTIACTLSD